MSPRRLLARPLLVVTVFALSVGACNLSPPDPTATPPATATAASGPSPEATATASATPIASATPVAFRPAPSPALARWERIEVDGPLPSHRAYHLATNEIWGLVRDDGVEMSFGGGPFLFFGPDAETRVLLGTTAEHESSGETVTVDLATGEVVQVLPFGVNRATWQVPGVVRFVLDYPVREAGQMLLPAGAWLLDLATSLLTPEVETPWTLRFALPQPLPDATYHPGATAVLLRPTEGVATGTLALVDENSGTERVMERAVSTWSPTVSPDGHWLA
ncbi:MAG: hypothetical protein DWG83_01805 [Chloroflexi bacterium]|nr:hypothetical protein [Chloroflexota bacterium]MQC19292.1 hypothetical protein [Chloroflexota bacterium]